MNDFTNYRILEIDNQIAELLQSLPVSVAYYIMKNKTNELEQLYLTQSQKEFEQMQAAAAQEQQSQEPEVQVEE